MRNLRIALPVLLVFASPSVFADQVAFKNGDRLTGAILKSDAKNLRMTTAVAGEVTVSWQEIQEFRSDVPLGMVLANGKELLPNSGVCFGPTTRSGVFTKRPLRQRESRDLGLTHFGRRIDHCWTAWERLSLFSRS